MLIRLLLKSEYSRLTETVARMRYDYELVYERIDLNCCMAPSVLGALATVASAEQAAASAARGPAGAERERARRALQYP